MTLVPVEIEKVLELEGAYRPDFNCLASVYAHISKPVRTDLDNRYALLAIFPQHGIMHLGEINPNTRMFEHYDMRAAALYRRAGNHVIEQVSVPASQLVLLKPIDDVIAIPGIKIKRELFPKQFLT